MTDVDRWENGLLLVIGLKGGKDLLFSGRDSTGVRYLRKAVTTVSSLLTVVTVRRTSLYFSVNDCR